MESPFIINGQMEFPFGFLCFNLNHVYTIELENSDIGYQNKSRTYQNPSNLYYKKLIHVYAS